MTPIQQAAQDLLNDGWELVRIKKGEKRPASQWKNAKPKAEDFVDGDQIAGKAGAPSGRRVCLDGDCPEVVALLPRFINSDNAHIEGRPGKPRSHWWILSDAPTRRYKDVDGSSMLDVLSTGAYAVLPPSVWSDGKQTEYRAWVEPRPNLTLHEDPRMFSYVVTAALIARHWPSDKGSRHELAGPLAGLLLRCDVSEMMVKQIIEQALHVAGDDQLTDRMNYVRDTIAKFKAGQPTRGGKTLATLLGFKVKQRICSFLSTSDFGVLDELNERWFITDVGAETVVAEEIEQTNEDKTRKWTTFTFRPFSRFRDRLVKADDVVTGQNEDGDDILKPAADYWLEHPEGRQYDHLVYAPPGSGIACDTMKDPPDLNGWKGFTVEPAPGDWSKTKAFILDVICNGDTKLYEWFLDWCADLFQRPGHHADTVPTFTGPQGIGKNKAAEDVIGRCFDGRHAAAVFNLNGVLGEFNEKLSGLCYLVLDEVQMSAAQSVAMRALVTGDTLDINRKGIARSSERNMLHMMILSNNPEPVTIDKGDRRFAFFAVSAKHKEDHAYFAALLHELDHQGGRAAMLHDLLTRKYDPNTLRRAPDTSAKQSAKAKSLGGQPNALRHWLSDEKHVGELEVIRDELFTTLRGQHHQADESGWTNDSLGQLVRSIWPSLPPNTKRRVNKQEKRTYRFGIVSDARDQFDAYFQIVTDWPSSKMDDLVTMMEQQTTRAINLMGTPSQLQNLSIGLVRLGTTILRKIGVDTAPIDQAAALLTPPIRDEDIPF